MSQEGPTTGSEIPAETPPETGKSLFGRIAALVTAPRSVFEGLAIKPSWIGAAALLALFSFVIGILIWDPVILPYSLEQAEKSATSSEQLAQLEAFYSSGAMKIIAGVLGPVFNLIWIFFTGLLMFGVCNLLLGGRTTIKHGMAVAAHAMLVLIPRSLVLLPIMFSRGDPNVSLGPGVLFPQGEASGFGEAFIASFLAGLDLFNLWALALCVLGMSVVAKLPIGRVGGAFSTGYLVVIVIWSMISGATNSG